MYPNIGPLKTYGLFYVGGIIAYFVISLLFARRMQLRYRLAVVLSLCYLLGMTVGAKILYDIQQDHLNLPALLRWKHYDQGGLWGGPLAYIALAGPLVLLVAKQKRAALDLVVLPLPIPMILSKLGCLCHGCCYGSLCFMPWALRFPEGGSAPAHLPLHPTQGYEILVLVCILAAFRILNHPRRRGMMLLWFLALYGLGRALTEIWRGDSQSRPTFGFMSISQAVCLGAAIVSLILLWIFRLRTAPHPAPAELTETDSQGTLFD